MKLEKKQGSEAGAGAGASIFLSFGLFGAGAGAGANIFILNFGSHSGANVITNEPSSADTNFKGQFSVTYWWDIWNKKEFRVFLQGCVAGAGRGRANFIKIMKPIPIPNFDWCRFLSKNSESWRPTLVFSA